MSETLSFHRDIPVRQSVDICVVGGGPAGVAAAVTAARQGQRVFLIEGMGCFGGMGTSGGLAFFCFLTDGVHLVADGIGREVRDRLIDAGGVAPDTRTAMDYQDLQYNPETLKRVYDDMVVESGAEFTFFTRLVGVDIKDGHVRAVICHGKSGFFAVQAQLFIDCTGDGDLCALAGAPYEKGDAEGNLQPGTLCSLWTNVDWDRANAAGHGMWKAEGHLPRAIADGVFTLPDRHLPGFIQISKNLSCANVGHTFGVDGTDDRSVTAAMVLGRKLLLEYERFYKEYLVGYEEMELAGTGALLGVRETRRILGDYVLTKDDFLRRASFADEIGRYCYPIDIHPAKPTEETFAAFVEEFAIFRYAPGENYGIPYRCLIPQGLSNVLVAGRPISVDHMMFGSTRVMPCCFITGQAAGMAASIAVQQHTDTRQVPVTELQDKLHTIGAYLPSYQSAIT